MFLQSLKMSISAILSNKMRSFLTMLGVIIGVVALVVLVSLVSSATGSITDQVSSLGTDMLSISIVDDKENPLRLTELNDIAQQAGVDAVTAQLTAQGTGKHGRTNEPLTLYGVTAAYEQVRGMKLEYGRFLRTTDVENNSYVAVASYEAAETFFGQANAVGETLYVNGRSVTIVGVLEDDSSSMTALMGGNNVLYLPYPVAARISGTANKVSSLYVSAQPDTSLETVSDSVEDYMLARFRHDEDAYRIVNLSSIMDVMDDITGTLSLVLGGIAAISLLVGGIGIMNIMLVSVTERTREIGIRKAIGAGRSSIMMQFLLEALTLSLMGCALGVLTSWGLISAIQALAGEALTFTIALSPGVVLLAVVFSASIGVIFGVYPANKAASKNPIEALRYEG